MTLAKTLVMIVDDDPAQLEALTALLRPSASEVQTFASADQLLRTQLPTDVAYCILSDVKMPGMNGLELLQALKRDGFDGSIIFLSAHGDVEMAVKAMQEGATHFLEKPYPGQQLRNLIKSTLSVERSRMRVRQARRNIRQRLSSLTPREAEVMSLMVKGKPTKNIAQDLRVSPKTIECHRAKVMRKAQVTSLAELVKISLLNSGELCAPQVMSAFKKST